MRTRRLGINDYPFIFNFTKLSILVLGGAVFLLSLCSVSLAQTPASSVQKEKNTNYKIGVGDVLQVLVLKQTILSQDNVRVSNEGTIRMPMLEDDIPVACLTEAQLSQEITKRYKKFLINPQVYVSVKEFNANPVAVVGAVNSPGRFQLQRPMRILDLLTYVNGPSVNAGQVLQIFRDTGAKQCTADYNVETKREELSDDSLQKEIITLSLPDLLKGNESTNLYVQSGDIIRVPEAELKQAFIIGNVKTPATINLKEPVSLSKAIAMAGGFSQGAKTDKIKITRQSPDGLAKTEILVNLKDNKNQTQEEILLQPNDIIEVPGPKPSFLKDLIRGVIPAVTRMPVMIP